MLLFIVARDQSALYDTLEREFAAERDVTVVLDRRHGERRRNGRQSARAERRQSDRRIHLQVDASLRSLGWAIIHSER